MNIRTVLLTCLVAAQPALGQVPTPNFSGVWVMDTTKFAKHDPVLVALKLTIKQTGDSLTIVSDIGDQRGGPTGPITKTTTTTPYRLDGKPIQNLMVNGTLATNSLAWNHDTLVMVATGTARDSQTLTITTRWTLDAKRTTLTQQQRMEHGARLANQTLLFTKQ